MTTSSDDGAIVCSHCKGNVVETATFCPHCGDVFSKGIPCKHHPDRYASGACVLCGELCCSTCGTMVNGTFLCNGDRQYEVMKEMAKVYGVTDDVQAQYVCDCLTKSGLHPYLYSRSYNPPGEVAKFMASQVYGRTLCEMKIFVPFTEVAHALDILDELEVMEC